MSTSATPGAKSGPDQQAKLRLPNPQFIPLSQLASQRLTLRDLLPVVPAALISLIFNSALVVGLLWYNSMEAKAASNKPKTQQVGDDNAPVDQTNKTDKDFIDVNQQDLGFIIENKNDPAPKPEVVIPGTDKKEDVPVGFKPPPDPKEAFTAGIGHGTDGNTQGNDGKGIEGIKGFPGVGEYGQSGKTGAGIMGRGTGLLSGEGGGSSKGGGFGYRTGDLTEIAKREGGNDESQRAVADALKWIAEQQYEDGHWSLDKYPPSSRMSRLKGTDADTPATHSNDTAATAFGLLPLLGAGHHHKKNCPYKMNVFRGLDYLCRKQEDNGNLSGKGQSSMYAHALATIALCEAYAMSKDDKLKPRAQKALDYLVYAQNTTAGGWRYGPRPEDGGDTSVVGWVVMALRSGQIAGLNVPNSTMDLARKWLDDCSHDEKSKYSYTRKSGPSPNMTAAGLLCRQYLGWGPRSSALHKGCEYMLLPANTPPAKGPGKGEKLGRIYYYYYATQVIHHMAGQGPYWEKWNPPMRDFLIRIQEREGAKLGSWNPNGADYGGAGGRMYSTSLAILTLEIYYRYLPMYRTNIETAMDRGDRQEQPMKEEKKP